MSHEIWGDMFAGVRVGAWHQLGKVYPEAVTPSFAAADLGLLYEVEKFPLMIETPNGNIPSGMVMVGRINDTELVNFGVSSVFDVTMLVDVLPNLDELSTKYPLSATGSLRKGAMCFFTFGVSDSTTIADEEYKEYITIVHSYAPGVAHKMIYSPVRTVCMNTMVMAEDAATSKVAVSHTAGSKIRLDAAYVLTAAMARASAVKKQLEMLTTIPLTTDAASTVIKKTYARYSPSKALDPFVLDLVEDSVMTTLYSKRESQDKYVSNLTALANGAYAKLNDEYPAHSGTAYNLFNAIVEVADHRKSRGTQGAAESALVGVRAGEKRTAFELLMAMA